MNGTTGAAIAIAVLFTCGCDLRSSADDERVVDAFAAQGFTLHRIEVDELDPGIPAESARFNALADDVEAVWTNAAGGPTSKETMRRGWLRVVAFESRRAASDYEALLRDVIARRTSDDGLRDSFSREGRLFAHYVRFDSSTDGERIVSPDRRADVEAALDAAS